MFLSAVDGRALKTFSNELTDNESSSNRFTNVYLYNAENRDIEVDFRIIFDDGTTAIYDGDDDDEWVSLNNQKYTTSGSWRQVVLTAQNGERYEKNRERRNFNLYRGIGWYACNGTFCRLILPL